MQRDSEWKHDEQRMTTEESAMTYEIRIEGLIDDRWSEWLGGMALTHEDNGETVLLGELRDQTALQGVLERIRDLGLELISVRRLDGSRSDYTTDGNDLNR